MKKIITKILCAVLAAMLAVGGAVYTSETRMAGEDMPELVSYIDDDGTVTIEEEEVPLATKPVVKTKTTTKKTVKKVKLKTKAAKSSTKTTTKTNVKNSTKTTKTQKIQTKTTTKTTTKTALKKKSNIKTITTTVVTTVKTTTTALTTNKTQDKVSSAPKNVAIRTIAPKAHGNVLKAFETLNFTVRVDSSVNYSGKFDAKTQMITVHTNSDEAIYHELGHFVAFLAGNADTKSDFVAIYKSEISNFKGTRNNDSYIKSTSAEYFAESYQDYIERPDHLKSARPQTYKYIADCVSKVTDARVSLIKQLYASQWK